MKGIDIILEEARKNGATIPPPASAEDLKQCQKDLAAIFYPPIPQRYFAFLQECNGYYYGVTFYGTKPFPMYDYNGFVDDLVTANKQLGHNKYMKHGLLIGHGWDYKYFYNTKTGLFETRNNFVNDVDAEYKTFKAMFDTETIRG